MHHRRPTARHRSLAALLLTVSVAATLSSCGFDYPTDRVNQIAAGANNREGDVEVLGIRVLATAGGQGRVIGSIDNNLLEPVTLTGITSPDGDVTADIEPLKLDADTAVNLATESNLPVTGDFEPGQVVSLEFTFSDGETVGLETVPVVKNCYQYTAVPTPSADASSSESASEGESASADSGSGSSAFECSDQETPPAGEEGSEEGE